MTPHPDFAIPRTSQSLGILGYFVAKLDCPLPFQHMGGCSTKCNSTMFLVTSIRQCREICHLSRGIIAQSRRMKSSTDIKHILKQMNSCMQDLTCVTDLPVASRNNAPASSTAGPSQTTRSVQNYPNSASSNNCLQSSR